MGYSARTKIKPKMSHFFYGVAVKFALAYEVARGDKIAGVHQIARRYFSTKTLLHEGITLHEDTFAQADNFARVNFLFIYFSISLLILILMY